VVPVAMRPSAHTNTIAVTNQRAIFISPSANLFWNSFRRSYQRLPAPDSCSMLVLGRANDLAVSRIAPDLCPA
jgi:hypothetical protein